MSRNVPRQDAALLRVVEYLVQRGNSSLDRHVRQSADEIYRRHFRKLVSIIVAQSNDTDPPPIGLEEVSTAYEHLLELEASIEVSESGRPIFGLRRGHGRKTSGSFFTPPKLIEELLRSALDPVVGERLQGSTNRADALLGLRICDPACGTGNFLLAAARRLANELMRIRGGELIPALTDVCRHCIHGVDCDPLAIDLCRAAIGKECGGKLAWATLENRIRVGDALEAKDGARFDVVLGNPPYGTKVSATSKTRLRTLFPAVSKAGNSAAWFVARACEMMRADGRVGLVMPKSITYSHAWAGVRELIGPRLISAADVGRAWSGVRLEQVLVTFAGSTRPIPSDSVVTTDIIPTGLSSTDSQLLEQILRASRSTLSSVCFTRRGSNIQGRAQIAGSLGLLAGKDIAEFAPTRSTRFIDPETIPPSRLRVAEPGQAVFQNIVAHLTRPTDHIRLIGTVVDQRVACLDTVNLIYMKSAQITSAVVCGLLMSDLVNWFVHVCVYNRAVRTMHFDNFVFAKIPMPELNRLAPLTRTCATLLNDRFSEDAWRELNELVFNAYGIGHPQREAITKMHKARVAGKGRGAMQRTAKSAAASGEFGGIGPDWRDGRNGKPTGNQRLV